MKSTILMDFSIDKANRKINVTREFTAPLSRVWAAWTESELLDQWWAPKPWKSRTKRMDFREGGHWLYAMVGPNGEEQWGREDFKSIVPLKSFTGQDAFCNENGDIDHSLPIGVWTNKFIEKAGSTIVNIEIEYENLSDLEKITEMGFREGFTAAMDNLDELLDSK